MILVVAETRDGGLNPAVIEAVAAAHAMEDETAVVVVAGDATAALASVAVLDVVEIVALEHEALTRYTSDGFVAALEPFLREASPRCVVFPHTYQTRDYAPLLAVRLGWPLIPDCTAVRVHDAGWRFTRPMFRGKVSADVVADAPCLVSVQVGAFSPDAARRGTGGVPVRRVQAPVDPARIRQRPEPPFQEARPSVDLAHAARLVAVGRGIKNRDQLPVAQALADALGAELAASRPICDAGWLPMDRQVGSSGQTVRPTLYVALGISGAIQHIVGMRGSRTVVAINIDPDAPIFEIADYGIVGDLFEIVPAIVAALKA